MTYETYKGKDPGARTENPLLDDLSIEHCVDELFRPYLHPAITDLPLHNPVSATPPPVSAPSYEPIVPRTAPGQFFETMARSLTSLWQALEAQALTRQDATPVSIPASGQATTPAHEDFAPAVVPRTISVAPPPLPHEVREELLELRTEVMHAIRTQSLQTLMICGVEPGVGTSFVAGQLTRLLAEYAQMKVAFLTIVSQREKSTYRLVRRAVPSHMQFLMRRTELPNLAEIASANGAISLTELLCQYSTTEVLRQMKAEFDLIVIDAPAVAMYAEAAMLAALMDGVILVAEPNVTPLRRMDRAHRRLHKAQAKVLGMVFNRQRRI